MGKANLPKAWDFVRSEVGPDLHLFNVRHDWYKNPRNSKELKRLVLETPDWVNIVAITPDKKIVTVNQFRFGVKQVISEIPGGLIDAGESSKDAAIRELKEETGYTSSHWIYLGYVQPNPAFHTNLCHHWLANHVQKTDELRLDEGEDITVATLTYPEMKEKILKGKFRHVLALSALSRVIDLWDSFSASDFHENTNC
jgi:8-oxo-dGTP pyrophosphatase MutT (NUDIX family)